MTWHKTNPARYALFHKLWGKASLAAGYIKDEWLSFERVLFRPDDEPSTSPQVEERHPEATPIPPSPTFDTAKWYSVDQDDG